MTIRRVPLRDQVYDEISGRVLRNELPSGTRISDSVLAEELGVSRTPVREALLRMEREGFLEADLHRGFFVKQQTAAEVEEAYPVLWTLEGLALRSSGPASPETLAELERINRELVETDDPERRLELDTLWHSTLLSQCSNGLLLGMVDTLKSALRRYEHAYMRDAGLIPASHGAHEEIRAAFAASDNERAAALLEEHWRFGRDVLLRWLEGAGGASG